VSGRKKLFSSKKSLLGFILLLNRSLAQFLLLMGAILLLAVILLMSENLNQYEQQLRASMQMEFFLRDDSSADELRTLQDQIQTLPGYQSQLIRDKAEVYALMQSSLGVNLLPRRGINPFPNTVVVRFQSDFANALNFELCTKLLGAERCIEEVHYNREALAELDRNFAFYRRLSFLFLTLGYGLVAAAAFFGARKLMLTRRQEITALYWLGASWLFLCRRFVLRSMFVCLLAGASALSGLYLLWKGVAASSGQLAFISTGGTMLVMILALSSTIVASASGLWLKTK
jgi:cell division protein FtsX